MVTGNGTGVSRSRLAACHPSAAIFTLWDVEVRLVLLFEAGQIDDSSNTF
jgi:hypothetical protein